MAKNLINKYVWLVDTIYKAGRITYEEINEKWLDQDMDTKPIPIRTFHKWKIAAEDMFNLVIECERKGGYHYYIDNKEEVKRGGLRNWLLNTISVSNALANSQSIKDRILLEYVPSGQDYLKPIIDAMKENRVLNITYQSYWNDEENDFKVQPYCVKLFKQRWYMVAKPDYDEKQLRIYSLDRILKLHITDETFKMPKNWNAEDYFKDSYGIFVDKRIKPQRVLLKVNPSQANYIRDLRLHESQEEIARNNKYSVFRYWLSPQYDFIQELLWNGADVEVIEPQELRDQMTEIIKSMWKKYRED